MEKNVKSIVLDIKRNQFLNRGNIVFRSSENGVICRMDCSEFSPEDLIGKQVVYYILTNGKHYIGRTDAFDRRMSEHLRRDSNLYQHFLTKEFIVKPIKVFEHNEGQKANECEKEAIAFAKMIMKNDILINKL